MQNSEIYQIKKICILSSYACSLFSIVYSWLTPVGGALGIISEIAPKRQKSCQEEFKDSVSRSIDRMLTEPSIRAHREIFDELIREEVDVSNLEELISKTEVYKLQHYTNRDVKSIVQTFESYLREEISKKENLPKLISLQFYESNMRKLESIYDILSSKNEEMWKITSSLNESICVLKQSNDKIEDSNKILNIGRKCLNVISNSITYTLMAMFAYLLMSIFLFFGLEPKFVIVAPISYFISNILIAFSKNNEKLRGFSHSFGVRLKTYGIRLSIYTVQTVFAISIFIMVLCAANTSVVDIMYPLVALTVGSIFGCVASKLL